MVRFIEQQTGDRLVVLHGDPATAAQLWREAGSGASGDWRGKRSCRGHAVAVSLVRTHGRVWWAEYGEGFWQPYFGGQGGGFCAHSLSLTNPRTLHWETITTF